MADTQMTDGMVLDHVAEFLYYPKRRLQALYAADRVGYVDALTKFVQLVATGDRLAMAAKPPNNDMGRLKEELGDVVDTSPISFSLENRASRTAWALEWLRSAPTDEREPTPWQMIDSHLAADEDTALALAGHVKREFERCFVLRCEEMNGYVEPRDALPLSPRNMRGLTHAAQSLPSYGRARVSEQELTNWLLRTVTTHYRNFGEYMCLCNHDYTPAATRSRLSALLGHRRQAVMSTVAACIAVKVLGEAVKYGDGRKAVAQAALAWRLTSTGEAVRAGVAELKTTFPTLSPEEREQLMSHINRTAEGRRRGRLEYNLNLALGTTGLLVGLNHPGVLGSLIAAEGVVRIAGTVAAATTSRAPKSLRWLFSIRQPNVAHALFSLVDKLVQS